MRDEATPRVKAGLAVMLKGGVIMDVVTPEQAQVAEEAGAAAVMALERVPADIRRDGGVARMSDPAVVKAIQEAVTIPVMAKARIGHFVEAQLLEALEIDYVDESEVLTPADEANHIDKWAFKVPFVCGATNLGEALRRIGEGAAMIRTKGEAGTGNVVEAVRHMRAITGRDPPARRARASPSCYTAAKQLQRSARAGPGDPPRAAGCRWCNFCGRRHRDTRRRRAHDGAGGRGGLRGLGHLQVRRPCAAGAGDRRGDHPLPRPRARRGRQRRPGRRDDQPRGAQARSRAAARRPRLVRIGVLALQGDFEAHARMLEGLGAQPVEVRTLGELDGLDGLIVPGGESTVMARGIEREGLADPIRALVAAGTPVLGTCAGLIMLDREHLGVMDVLAQRNAFGRQVHSFEADLEVEGLEGPPLRAVFIRAPWVCEHGERVEVLASVDGHPVAVRQANLLAVAFHPELAGDARLHELFLSAVRQ